ncbi:hypothetical protein SPBR_08165 [Sporothrix brasiliensis 5110]|uniref:Uncharacterized protein n=1 Tax=Sporothrix brasiliensis 5110 TaxID=1398154 RepID=A0A0C2IBX4_9PEZI|nr:uncharacterized protein SPBR_08165 [Sporothrix brasiliensis 5110]KIH86776.1 hypothetical protein SPBR_08165 [Sporothrix brasiliensis 5110]
MSDEVDFTLGRWQPASSAISDSNVPQEPLSEDVYITNLRREELSRESKQAEQRSFAMGRHPSYLAYMVEQKHQQKQLNAAPSTQSVHSVQPTRVEDNHPSLTSNAWQTRRLGHLHASNASAAEAEARDMNVLPIGEMDAPWPKEIGHGSVTVITNDRSHLGHPPLSLQPIQNSTTIITTTTNVSSWLASRQPLAGDMTTAAAAATTRSSSRFFDPTFGSNNNSAGVNASASVQLAPMPRLRIDASKGSSRAPLQPWSEGKVAHNGSHLDSIRNITGNGKNNGNARINKTPTAIVCGDDTPTSKATTNLVAESTSWIPSSSANLRSCSSNSTGDASNINSIGTSITQSGAPSPVQEQEPSKLSRASLVINSIDNVASHEETTATVHGNNLTGNGNNGHGNNNGNNISQQETQVPTTRDVDTSAIIVASLGPPAPGFLLPMTGYEFELNHGRNLLELHRQKQWAQAQLFSCNENNRFKHTQTTACIVAVNGRIIGPYRAESLRCYGTNPEIEGLRVTMTVNEGDNRHIDAAEIDSKDAASMPVFRNATLVLRHQIIMTHPLRTYHHHHQKQLPHHDFSQYMPPSSSNTTSIASLMSSLPQLPGSDRASALSTSTRARTNTGQSTASSSIGGGTASTAPSTSHRYSISSTVSGASSTATSSSSHQQGGRRYLFATTTIPLYAGIAARPGYRPVEASAAAERIHEWGGRPDKGVFGNSWLVHMAIEPGHVQHDIDTKIMEQVQRLTSHRNGGGRVDYSGGPDAPTCDATEVQIMRMVNESMAKIVAREGTLSVMLSNHVTQKRIARQCPDLVAMWVMAQEHL